jgi:hypothetical protein
MTWGVVPCIERYYGRGNTVYTRQTLPIPEYRIGTGPEYRIGTVFLFLLVLLLVLVPLVPLVPLVLESG